MNATEPYFTFPLFALRYGNSAHDMLDSLIDYGIVYAGLKVPAEEFDDWYREAEQKCSIKKLPSKSDHEGRAVLVGSLVCNVTLGSWTETLERYHAVRSFCGPNAWHLRMRAEWVWRAQDTALVDAGLQPGNSDFDYQRKRLTFDEFRILAAILSAVAAKRFDWLGWETIRCRAAGFMRRQDYNQTEDSNTPHFLKPPLTRWRIDKITRNLEAWGFFARFRFSSGNRGGTYAYSVTCADRNELAQLVLRSKVEKGKYSILDNRAQDLVQSLSIKKRKLPASCRQLAGNAACKSPAIQIERSNIKRSDIKRPPYEKIQKIIHPYKPGCGDSLDSFSKAELEYINIYNDFCDKNRSKRFRKLNMATDELRKALDRLDAENIDPHELLEMLQTEAENQKGARTFVRLVWNNV